MTICDSADQLRRALQSGCGTVIIECLESMSATLYMDACLDVELADRGSRLLGGRSQLSNHSGRPIGALLHVGAIADSCSLRLIACSRRQPAIAHHCTALQKWQHT